MSCFSFLPIHLAGLVMSCVADPAMFVCSKPSRARATATRQQHDRISLQCCVCVCVCVVVFFIKGEKIKTIAIHKNWRLEKKKNWISTEKYWRPDYEQIISFQVKKREILQLQECENSFEIRLHHPRTGKTFLFNLRGTRMTEEGDVNKHRRPWCNCLM